MTLVLTFILLVLHSTTVSTRVSTQLRRRLKGAHAEASVKPSVLLNLSSGNVAASWILKVSRNRERISRAASGRSPAM